MQTPIKSPPLTASDSEHDASPRRDTGCHSFPTTGFLGQIIEATKERIAQAQETYPLERLKDETPVRTRLSMSESLSRGSETSLGVIAEIKFASPSKGDFQTTLSAESVAKEYQAAGTSAISVLTEPRYFKGSLDILASVRAAVPTTPLLRKDFIIDSYQIWESRYFGADALLLITAALSDTLLATLLEEALSADLEVLLETHSTGEISRALQAIGSLPANSQRRVMLGANCRDLHTLELSSNAHAECIQAVHKLISDTSNTSRPHEVPLMVAESGIRSKADLPALRALGYRGVLIGEAFMRGDTPGKKLREMVY